MESVTTMVTPTKRALSSTIQWTCRKPLEASKMTAMAVMHTTNRWDMIEFRDLTTTNIIQALTNSLKSVDSICSAILRTSNLKRSIAQSKLMMQDDRVPSVCGAKETTNMVKGSWGSSRKTSLRRRARLTSRRAVGHLRIDWHNWENNNSKRIKRKTITTLVQVTKRMVPKAALPTRRSTYLESPSSSP